MTLNTFGEEKRLLPVVSLRNRFTGGFSELKSLLKLAMQNCTNVGEVSDYLRALRNMTFGDVSATIAVLHREIVSKRRWISEGSRSLLCGLGACGRKNCTCGGNQPRTYLLNQSIVRCQARSAAALLYRSGVASQLKPCPAPG
jgi:hypothetical protein